MINTETSNLFAVHRRFLRSTHLERDWHDPEALQNYTLTPHALLSLRRLAEGLRPKSSLRAWRITGDYGSGKSSFALLVANLFSRSLSELPISLQRDLRQAEPPVAFLDNAPALLPVLVTGSREPMGTALLRALASALHAGNPDDGLIVELQTISNQSETCSDEEVLKYLIRAQQYVRVTNQANGLLIILDEAGKFLEYASERPDQQDVFLLQRLAETAARSQDAPLFVLALLHQGVSAYTESLSKAQQREWEKVAGRFEEITWFHPVEQVATLVAHALQTQLDQVPSQTQEAANEAMQGTLKLRWFGVDIAPQPLIDIAAHLYPIHPTVLPPLVRLFAGFGQNERSLYSFLLGTDPNGLQDFVARTEGKSFFRLHNLFDYARSAFGSRLAALSYHWKAIDGIIQSYQGDQVHDLETLKTIGLLNLLNTNDLVASLEALSLALDLGDGLKKSLLRLQGQHMLYYRGMAGGYCVWSTSSVNLDEARTEARKALGSITNLPALIREKLEVRPLVARGHYISTGNLRYFDVQYVEVASLVKQLVLDTLADGYILVPLCETPADVTTIQQFVLDSAVMQRADVLIAIPRPLRGLTVYLEELRQWEWVERSIGELRHDRYAREEVSRKIALAQQALAKQLQASVGLLTAEKEGQLTWYHQGRLLADLRTGRDVLALLTKLCNDIYGYSPFIHNELINRKNLSSAGAAARLRLCEKLFESANQPFLGMDPEKHPPEMSMYLSVLQEAGLHQPTDNEGIWKVTLPSEVYDQDHCRVLPAMHHIHDVLAKKPDVRVAITNVFSALRQAPYGVRDGLSPLLLAVFAVIHEQELAFYEDGSFIPRITGTNFLRLIKAPETFEVQYYPHTGIRNDLFHQLIRELGLRPVDASRVDLLDVVKPLLVFIANLPEYALKTTRLSPKARSVRSTLMTTVDPARLIFHDLPKTCGVAPILAHSADDEANQLIQVHQFVTTLKSAVDELRAAYPNLLQSLRTQLLKELQLTGNFEKIRPALANRAKELAEKVTEPRLKSFCLRLADRSLGESKWLESLGNLVCSMPPARWRDVDEYKFEQEIHRLSAQFLRVEAVVFSQLETTQPGESVRLALTLPNGEERDQVVHLAADQQEEMQRLEGHLRNLLEQHGQLGMAAASRVLWDMIAQNKP